MKREDHYQSPAHLSLPWSRNWPRSISTKGIEGAVTQVFPVTPLQPWMTTSQPECLNCLKDTQFMNVQLAGVLTILSRFMIEPPSLPMGGPLSLGGDGVEAEVSSFSFKLKNPKGIRPSVHDELILRGLGSPHEECRNAANDLLLMKQTHRSYTKNQLRRRENKFIDIFLSGKNFPTPEDVEKDLLLSLQTIERCC